MKHLLAVCCLIEVLFGETNCIFAWTEQIGLLTKLAINHWSSKMAPRNINGRPTWPLAATSEMASPAGSDLQEDHPVSAPNLEDNESLTSIITRRSIALRPWCQSRGQKRRKTFAQQESSKRTTAPSSSNHRLNTQTTCSGNTGGEKRKRGSRI